MRAFRLAMTGLYLAGSLACQARPKQVFAYRLPDSTLPATGGDPPPKAIAGMRRPAPFDLNRASAKQLAGVPGLNLGLAERIIAARPWRAKRDLLRRHFLTPQQYAAAKVHLIVHRLAPAAGASPRARHVAR